MNKKMEYGEREINLLHLVCYLLERYKSLIIMMIIGIVLSIGIGMILPPNYTSESAGVDIANYEPTDEMIQNMDIAVQYRRLYEQQKEYNENSLIMKMDPNGVYEGKAVYYIDSADDLNQVMTLYSTIINEEEFLEKAAKEAATTPSYIKEIVDVSYFNDLELEETDVSKGVIIYNIVHFDKNTCENLLNCLEEYVDKYQQDIIDKEMEYSLEEITKLVTVKVYSECLKFQHDNISVLNDYYAKKVSYENKFADEDQLYYQINYLNEDIDIEQAGGNSMLKRIVVGAAAAIFLWGMFWGIRYLFDNRIHTKEEVERRYNFPIIGHVEVKGKRDLYSKWKKYTFDTEEYLKYTLCSLKDNGIVFSSYDGNKMDSDKIYCAKEYLWKNQKVMEKAKKTGNVVIGVMLEKSTYEDVEREIEMCLAQSVNISGIIVME